MSMLDGGLGRLAQGQRDALRHTLGKRFLERADALARGASPRLDPFAIHLHPATTKADYDWLRQEWSGLLVEAVDAALNADCSSRRGIAALKATLHSLLDRAEGLLGLIEGLDHVAECDSYPGSKPLAAARAGVVGAVNAYASIVDACTARDDETAVAAEERLHSALACVEAAHAALEAASATMGVVRVTEVLHCAFRVAPASAVYSVESCIGAYECLDPYKGALPDRSPHLRPPPAGVANRSDRLFAFAERQVRFLPLPSGTMDGLVAQDYMQIGYRLATENFRLFGHESG